MKVKGIYENHQNTKEHAYLGDFRSTYEDGYRKDGKIDRKTLGTSKTLHDDAGVVPKKGTDEKY